MTSPHSGLEIHPGIVLKGQLSMVKDVVITGRFEGDLRTEGRLIVRTGGTAIGTIEAGALVLEPGNHVEARVKVKSPGTAQPVPISRKKGPPAKWSLQKLKDMAMGNV